MRVDDSEPFIAADNGKFFFRPNITTEAARKVATLTGFMGVVSNLTRELVDVNI